MAAGGRLRINFLEDPAFPLSPNPAGSPEVGTAPAQLSLLFAGRGLTLNLTGPTARETPGTNLGPLRKLTPVCSAGSLPTGRRGHRV